jgi:hypothetical protein
MIPELTIRYDHRLQIAARIGRVLFLWSTDAPAPMNAPGCSLGISQPMAQSWSCIETSIQLSRSYGSRREQARMRPKAESMPKDNCAISIGISTAKACSHRRHQSMARNWSMLISKERFARSGNSEAPTSSWQRARLPMDGSWRSREVPLHRTCGCWRISSCSGDEMAPMMISSR